MPSLTSYKGLQVLTPDPTGAGGLAIQNDFKQIVDWQPKSVWSQSADPAAGDDENDNFFPGSCWLRTDVTPPKLFVCQSSGVGAAVWRQVLLRIAQDSSPALGAALDAATFKITNLADPTNAQDGATKAYVDSAGLGWMMQGRICGIQLSNNSTDATNDIDIAAGVAWASNDNAGLQLASALTKRLDAAWSVGTNQGGLDSGSKANSTWYHVWLIRRPDSGVVDALFSTSATSPTMPTNYSQSRRIGAVMTNGSGAILSFVQRGDQFTLTSPVSILSAATPPTSPTNLTLISPGGIACQAIFFAQNFSSVSGVKNFYLSEIGTSVAMGMTAIGGYSIATTLQYQMWTNTSSQILYHADSATNHQVWVNSYGWIDRRGQDA